MGKIQGPDGDIVEFTPIYREEAAAANSPAARRQAIAQQAAQQPPPQPFRPGGALPPGAFASPPVPFEGAPGDPVPDIEQEGGTPLAEYQEGDPLPNVSVTVQHPDGTLTGGYEMKEGIIREEPVAEVQQGGTPEPNYPPHSTHVDQEIGRAAVPTATDADTVLDMEPDVPGNRPGHDITGPEQLLHHAALPKNDDGTVAEMHYAKEVTEALILPDGSVNLGGVPIDHGFRVGPAVVRHIDCRDMYAELTVTYLVRQVTVEPGASVEEVPHHECDAGCVCQLREPTATIIDMVNRTRGSFKRFVLQRDRDDTGMSGTGIVAEGAVLSDGRAVVRWLGANSSIVLWDNLTELLNVHGHNGHTRLRWLDTHRPTQRHPDAPK